jgi:hypothetical protein
MRKKYVSITTRRRSINQQAYGHLVSTSAVRVLTALKTSLIDIIA